MAGALGTNMRPLNCGVMLSRRCASSYASTLTLVGTRAQSHRSCVRYGRLGACRSALAWSKICSGHESPGTKGAGSMEPPPIATCSLPPSTWPSMKRKLGSRLPGAVSLMRIA